jgi:hypothetical protein
VLKQQQRQPVRSKGEIPLIHVRSVRCAAVLHECPRIAVKSGIVGPIPKQIASQGTYAEFDVLTFR